VTHTPPTTSTTSSLASWSRRPTRISPGLQSAVRRLWAPEKRWMPDDRQAYHQSASNTSGTPLARQPHPSHDDVPPWNRRRHRPMLLRRATFFDGLRAGDPGPAARRRSGFPTASSLSSTMVNDSAGRKKNRSPWPYGGTAVSGCDTLHRTYSPPAASYHHDVRP